MQFKVDSLHPTRFSSLPRRKSSAYGEESFQRHAPARRSAGHAGPPGHAERCVEYFVPRSLSEFNLSAVGDLYDLSSDRRATVRGAARDKMVTFEDDRPAPPPQEDVFM